MAENTGALSQALRERVLAAGFDQVGIAPVTPGLGRDALHAWLAAGKNGEMGYMADQADARLDPNLVLPGAQSVVMASAGYATDPPTPVEAGFGKISRYAWGADYHDVLRQRLNDCINDICDRFPGPRMRAVVDSAPVMERDYAVLAGLGWIGKNCLLIHPRLGSWFFLGAILVDCPLDYDQPFVADHCGSCKLCLEACPTQAFSGPGQLDPRLCISYWTIESRTSPAAPLRAAMGDWVFGCDICQEVCPWNRRAPTTDEVAFRPAAAANPVSLAELLALSDAQFRARFRGTPLFRTKRSRVLRNACWVAGNQRRRELLPQLQMLLAEADLELREAALWAIHQIEALPQSPNSALAENSSESLQT